MNTFELLDRKAAQLIEEIEVAEYELDYLNEMYQVTGERKLEDRFRVYSQLAKLNQELIDTNLELDKYYVADHIEELNLFF